MNSIFLNDKKEKIQTIIINAVLSRMTGGKCKLDVDGGNWSITLNDTGAVFVL